MLPVNLPSPTFFLLLKRLCINAACDTGGLLRMEKGKPDTLPRYAFAFFM